MEPNCHGLGAQREKLDQYIGQGMSRDQVLLAFARDYGTQAILARPIDKGFNRLAWLFPYMVGVAGATAAFVIARRWSRHGVPEDAPAAADRAQDDPELRARLDHELRDLD
jgi:cytochrome c-type biogenesis protein CcmH/NrfF